MLRDGVWPPAPSPEQGQLACSRCSISTPPVFRWRGGLAGARQGGLRPAGWACGQARSSLCQASLETTSLSHVCGGSPTPPLNPEQVPHHLPIPSPCPGPSQVSPSGQLGICGTWRREPWAAPAAPGQHHNCFSTWSFQGAAGSQAGGLGVRRWRAWEERSFTLSIHRGKVDGAGWHFPLNLGE